MPPVTAAPSGRPRTPRSRLEPASTAMKRVAGGWICDGPRPQAHWFGRGQRFACHHAGDLVDSRIDAAVIVLLRKTRPDGFGDDAIGDRIGQGALQAVADLDAHAAVVLRNDQQHAVVDVRSTNAPLLNDPDRVLLDLLRLRRRYDQHRQLRTLLRLKAASFASNAERCSAVSVAVRSVTRALSFGMGCSAWHRRCRRCPKACQPRERTRGAAGRAGTCSMRVGGGAAGAAGRACEAAPEPKSTVGATAIADSLPTVKFGFTWKPNSLAVRFDRERAHLGYCSCAPRRYSGCARR